MLSNSTAKKDNSEDLALAYVEGDATQVVPFLQDVQSKYGYLSEEQMKIVANHLKLPLSKVYAIATFYKAFSLNPKGETILKLCIGTSCHIRGASSIIDDIKKEFSILPGETTADGKYSIETVGCVGACAIAPVVLANEEYITNVKPGTIAKRIKKALDTK